jgi:Zn-finger nucleic acid-binding protein
MKTYQIDCPKCGYEYKIKVQDKPEIEVCPNCGKVIDFNDFEKEVKDDGEPGHA